MATTKIPLKILVKKSTNKVLFAEANKQFVDFLFSLLAMPVGTIIQLLGKQKMVGSLGNIFDSLELLNATYLQANVDKNLLLKPHSQVKNALLLEDGSGSCSYRKSYYLCTYKYCRDSCISDVHGTPCPSCNNTMTTSAKFVEGKTGGGDVQSGDFDVAGYVKEAVTYMVTDDLAVTPMSMITTVTVLNKFDVKEMADLEERTVHVGMDEGLKLLKAALHSKTVLSDVLVGVKVNEVRLD